MKSLPSSGEARVQQAKRRLVLDIFLARGAAWEHIRDMRRRWEIEAQTQMPPPHPRSVYTPESLSSPPGTEFTEQAERWHTTFQVWVNDLGDLYKAIVPEEARDSEYVVTGWYIFLSMCVVFDPPDTRLEDFAESFMWDYPKTISHSQYEMFASPIVWRRDSNQVEATCIEYYEGLLTALLEKYVHPQGVTTEQAVGAIKEERPEVFERWEQRLHDNEPRPLIDVQPYHRQEDIESAHKVLSTRHETGPTTGRKKRDELTAVQCAVLHDRHNFPDQTDRRRRTWTHKRLAEEFALDSARAAKAHVQLGRELLDQYRGQ